MQAPTTPSGTPAQEPADRACPACGASNGLLAAFCWQCYQPFGAAAAGAPAPARPSAGGHQGLSRMPDGGLRGAVSTPTPMPVPERGRRNLGTMVGAVLVSVAVSAGFFFFTNRGPSVELPQSFGNLTKITNPQVDAAVEAFRAEADGGGFQTDMGLYGSAGTPSAGLVWVVDASVPTIDAAFTGFADGFNAGLGTGALDESRKTTETVNGVGYLCAPIVGSPPMNLCIWEEDEVFWILFDLSGSQMGATRALAVAARDAVVV